MGCKPSKSEVPQSSKPMYDDDSLYCLEPRLRSRRVFSPRRQVASRIKSPRYAVVLEETKEDPSLAPCPPAPRPSPATPRPPDVVEFSSVSPSMIGCRAKQLVELQVPCDFEHEHGEEREYAAARYEHKSGDGDFESDFDSEESHEAPSLASYLGCLMLEDNVSDEP